MAYRSFSYHKSYEHPKAQKSDMEKKFDDLLNEKCSWSYRSEKVVTSNKVETNSHDTSLELESTVMTIEISENKYDKEPSDTSSENSQENMQNERWLFQSPKIVNAAQNNKPKSRSILKNYGPQKKVNTIKDKPLRMEPKPKNSKRTIKSTDSGKVVQKRNLKHKDEQSILSSSSDEEILQSRHPIKDEKSFEENENSNDSSIFTSDQEIALKEENIFENNVNKKKTSPIIIQATAFNKNGGNNTDLMKQKPIDATLLENDADEDLHSETPLERSMSLESLSADSLTVELYDKTSTGNKNENLNIVNRDTVKNNYMEKDKLECHSENMSDIDSHSDLIDPYIGEFKNASDDHIISEFLNGSFDINTYKDPNKCPEDNFYLNNLEMNYSAENDTSLELFTDEDIFDLNIFKKRESNNVFDKNNHKESNEKGYKNKSFESPTIQYLSLPTNRKGQRRKSNQQNNLKKCKSERSFDEFDFVPEKTILKKSSNIRTKRKKSYKSPELEDTLIECINIGNSTDDEPKNVTRNKIKNSEINKKRKSNDFKENNAVTKRHARSSSLAASKRIEAIGKFENSAPSNDSDICFIHEEIKTTSLSKNIKKKLDKIAKDNLNNNSIRSKGVKIENLSNHKYDKNKSKEFNLINTKSNSTRKQKSGNVRVKNKSVENIYKNKLHFQKGKYSPRKSRSKKTPNKEWSLNLNLSDYNYNSRDEEDFENKVLHSKMKRSSTKNKKTNKSENKTPGNYNTRAYGLQKNANSIIAREGTEIKHKTWDDLELELLNELDNEMPLANAKNVSKTIIVKQERLVKKNRNSKNANFLTLSNASMTQTISKYAKGDSFNVQYAESKYVESKVNTCKYMTRSKFKSSLLNEVVSAEPQKMNPILENTMTAMEECTAEFLKPQVNGARKRSNTDLLLEEDNIDTNDMLQCNYILDENGEFISNEIATFTRENSKRKSYKNSNISNTIQDFNLSMQSNGIGQNTDTEHSNSFAHKRQPSENNARTKQIKKSQEIVPFNRTTDNPWNKLIKKCDLEGNRDQNNMSHGDAYIAIKPLSNEDLKKFNISYNYLNNNILLDAEPSENYTVTKKEVKESQEIVPFNKGTDNPWNKLIKRCDLEDNRDQTNMNNADAYIAIKPISNEDLKKFNISHNYLNNNMLHDADNIMENEIKSCDESLNSENLQDSIKKTQSKINLNYKRVNDKSNLMKIGESKIPSFNNNSTFTDSKSKQGENNTENYTEFNNMDKYEDKNNLVRCKKIKMPIVNKKSPTYKFKVKKDGSLKLKFNSSSSEDSVKMKSVQNKRRKPNKTKEKYIKYVKQLPDKELVLGTEETPKNHANALKDSSLVDSVENRNTCGNEIVKTTNPKLIAENDDDIFSLSSSDSEDGKSKEQIHGIGALCDLFDE